MISNNELARQFMEGYESGNAANMRITTNSDGAVLVVGYGHAVYAYRPPDDRFKPVVFAGWRGASNSTTQHISHFTGGDAIILDGRPDVEDVAGNPDLDALKQIPTNNKDYSTSGEEGR